MTLGKPTVRNRSILQGHLAVPIARMKRLAFVMSGASLLTCGVVAWSFDAAEAASASRTYVIDYYGDSTILIPVDQPSGTAPAILQSTLTARCGFPVTVNTKGVTTTRAIDALSGTNGYLSTFADAMAASKADMVIANYGINDARLKTSAAEFRSAIAGLGELARAHGKVMVYETANPVVDGSQTVIWDGENAWLGTLAATGISLAKSENAPVVDQYGYFMSLENYAALLFDGAHPTPATVRVKALRVADVVQPFACPS